jgi:hypothetical protein
MALQQFTQAVGLGRSHLHQLAGSCGEFVDGCLHDQPAVIDDHHFVNHLLQLGEDVAGHEHRAALIGERANVLAQPMDASRVQTVRRLVEDEQFRLAEDCRRDTEPLPHAQRETADPLVCRREQTNLGQCFVDPVRGRTDGRRDDAQCVAGLPSGMEPRLQDRAHEPAGTREVAVALPEYLDGAQRRLGEVEDHSQRRRLSGAIRAEESSDPTRTDVEAEPVNGGGRSEPLGQAVDGQHDIACSRHPKSPSLVPITEPTVEAGRGVAEGVSTTNHGG